TSPYLLQHKHNPVDWYPWCDEAHSLAKSQDKPIFLSIGYSACHWCHVMAYESFQCEETALIMNKKFINIKVDREERPDIDAVYMKAIIALIGHGGWPMSIFLTPDLKPFFGGTYFPPSVKYNRPGFPQVLEEAYTLYKTAKGDLENRTNNIMQKLQLPESSREAGDFSTYALIDEAVSIMEERFDSEDGGFGSGMKFPEPMNYTLLLRHWVRTGSDESIRMLDKTLTKMAEGGMYDQLGGGFHRYSTDRKWRVPHFEKMLYDNALLAKLYVDMAQATKQDLYSTVGRGIFDYIINDMTSPEGAFYSGQDADTEGEEGRYYFWSMKEFLDLLGPRNAKVMALYYGVTSSGHVDRKNVLYVKESMENVAKIENIAIFEVDHIFRKSNDTLLNARRKRAQPLTDTKIITGWNGLMITAFASGFMVLHGRNYLEAAIRAGEFLWENMWADNGCLLRIYNDGESKIYGCLEDYAYLLEGLISLYEASFDILWIERANHLADKMIEEFYDIDEGGFFMTGLSAEILIARLKNPSDEAIPSANAVAILNILKLGQLSE
ncbi:MAG: thioredoxin domain-containing protein, partial [Gammaproteobacteria bacterium]|nr:thioredoxin domain-containing protein [Gammaproteobacteria bacterium]